MTGFYRRFNNGGLQNFLQDIYSVIIRVIVIYIRCFAEKKIFYRKGKFSLRYFSDIYTEIVFSAKRPLEMLKKQSQ
jgi:hypothetical protein